MSEPIYGRLTPYELEKLGSGQFIEHGGRRVRITELVPRMDGGANYQAVEAEMQEQPLSLGRVDGGLGVLSVVGGGLSDDGPSEPLSTATDTEPPPAEDSTEDARAREDTMTVLSDDIPKPPPEIPLLTDWAKDNGWRGRGAIPKAVRAKYIETFADAFASRG